MKLVPYEKANIKSKGYKATKLLALIEEFRNSDWDGVKVEGWQEDYNSIKSAQASFINSIKRFKIKGVKTISAKDDLFLVKESEAAE